MVLFAKPYERAETTLLLEVVACGGAWCFLALRGQRWRLQMPPWAPGVRAPEKPVMVPL